MKSIPAIIILMLIASSCSSTGDAEVVQAAGPSEALIVEAEIATPTTYLTAPGSKVWFVIDEMFRGNPKTVVGVNSKVAAEVVADFDDPSSVVMGPVIIKAAYFDTEPGEEPSPLGEEVGWRDTAINRFILNSNDYPTITFTPSEIIDLTGIGEGGTTEVRGDLTVRDITRPVSFSVTFDVVSTEQIRVSGSSEVRRQDFDLKIPNVAHVADVADDLRLEFDLVFEPAGS
ncbi:MAG TPA: YceI family protein [Acidimicrobiia bacterium]|nr:YceI family protein [Acidimicrobiia bacterium]